MLHQIGIELELPQDKKIHSNMGSIFHGLLMELADSEEAAILHDNSGIRPYSQCVYFDKKYNVPVWRLNILEERTDKRLMNYILEQLGENLYLEKKGYNIKLKKILYETVSDYDKLADEIFLADKVERNITLDFMTTTSFKRDNCYVIMPELYLIFQSLIGKWNRFSDNNKLESEDLAKNLAAVCEIYKYKLQSQVYSVDGKNVYGFAGNISLKLHGNDMVNRIINLLLRFAPYSGIGAKTSLGMGAVSL